MAVLPYSFAFVLQTLLQVIIIIILEWLASK